MPLVSPQAKKTKTKGLEDGWLYGQRSTRQGANLQKKPRAHRCKVHLRASKAAVDRKTIDFQLKSFKSIDFERRAGSREARDRKIIDFQLKPF